MNITVDKATSLFEDLIASKKSVKVASDKKRNVEYWFDPKQSCLFGYFDGKPTSPVSEFAIKDADYLRAAMVLLSNIPNIKFHV